MMRLAVLNITGGGISGGHKKYLRNMLPRLAGSTEIEAILCASPTGMKAGEWLPALPKVTYAVCEPFRPFRHAPGAELKKTLDAFSPDILFIPIERHINYKNLPVVVMLQNMAPLAGVKTGSGLKELFIASARRYETRLALKCASKIVVPTEYVKEFLVENAGIPEGKMSAVHYGGDFSTVAARPPAAFPFLGTDFIFTAGSIEAYRGIEDLLLAFPALKTNRPGLKLAIAGKGRPATEKYFSRLKELAVKLKLTADIAWLGNLPEEELSWCYSNCAAFVLTSRMESFCFVALEALMHGCNIVSTDNACLPEILAEGAVYYKAGDVQGLTQNLENVLIRNPEAKAAFSKISVRIGSTFLWEDTARKTIDILKQAVPVP